MAEVGVVGCWGPSTSQRRQKLWQLQHHSSRHWHSLSDQIPSWEWKMDPWRLEYGSYLQMFDGKRSWGQHVMSLQHHQRRVAVHRRCGRGLLDGRLDYDVPDVTLT